jgi:hypothetical protein
VAEKASDLYPSKTGRVARYEPEAENRARLPTRFGHDDRITELKQAAAPQDPLNRDIRCLSRSIGSHCLLWSLQGGLKLADDAQK